MKKLLMVINHLFSVQLPLLENMTVKYGARPNILHVSIIVLHILLYHTSIMNYMHIWTQTKIL